MFEALPAERQAELQALAQLYGQPLLRSVELELAAPVHPLSMLDRYAEVCMVLRRPNGRLLTAIKDYYPSGAYRLLTGGVHHGENLLEALLREVREETSLQTELRRFLAAVVYTRAGQPCFYTFAFLLDEAGGQLAVADPAERLAAFGELMPTELPVLAERLASLAPDYDPEIQGRWQDWGRFRAVIHRVVWQALGEP